MAIPRPTFTKAAKAAAWAVALVALLLAGCATDSDQGRGAADPGEGDGDAAPPTGPQGFATGLFTGLTPIANLDAMPAGDLVFDGSILYTTSNAGTALVDISDPRAPAMLSMLPCRGRDINLFRHANRTVLIVSSQPDDRDADGTDGCEASHPTGGIRLIDATDPVNPVVGPQFPFIYGSHTNTPYGDTGYVYNSAYTLYVNGLDPATPLLDRVDILDARDFWNPVLAGSFELPAENTAPGCHDIAAEPERDRALCAGGTQTLVLDTTDPLRPVVTASVRNPLITYHHSAATARNGTLLVIADEWAGAIPPGGCAHRGALPQGALWFYGFDGGEPSALPLGHWSPPSDSTGICTLHEFNVIPGSDHAVGSLWTGGTFLVDFSDPAAPRTVEVVRLDGANTWAAYWHDGYAYAGDLSRGIDVFGLEEG